MVDAPLVAILGMTAGATWIAVAIVMRDIWRLTSVRSAGVSAIDSTTEPRRGERVPRTRDTTATAAL